VRKPLEAFAIALLALAGPTGTAHVTEWTPMAVVGIAYRWPTAKYGFPHQCHLVSSTKKYGYPFCKGCGAPLSLSASALLNAKRHEPTKQRTDWDSEPVRSR
jgi:hypothetical protein